MRGGSSGINGVMNDPTVSTVTVPMYIGDLTREPNSSQQRKRERPEAQESDGY